MVIEEVSYNNFRNIAEATLTLAPGTNVIWGKNAQGKTNLIEGIYFFARGKSFRAGAERELVRFGESAAEASVTFRREDRSGVETLSAHIPAVGRKSLTRDGIVLSGTAEMLGELCAVLFAPSHLALVSGSPGDRRSFLDIAIAQLLPAYVVNLRRYNRVLDQRNALIRQASQGARVSDAEWESYAELLADCAAYIAAARLDYISHLAPRVAAILRDMTGGAETPELFYKTHCAPKDEANAENSVRWNGEASKPHCAPKDEASAENSVRWNGEASKTHCAPKDEANAENSVRWNGDASKTRAASSDDAIPEDDDYAFDGERRAASEAEYAEDERELGALALGGAKPLWGVKADPAARERMRGTLLRHIDREIKAGYTLFGVHKDDVVMKLDGLDARTFCSQGQCRSIALAMKLAEGEISRAANGEYPVFLLDDVLSELDGARREYVLSSLDGRQLIVTSCEPDVFRTPLARLIEVSDGQIVSVREKKPRGRPKNIMRT